MRLRCPCCHAEFALEAATEDDAARELQGLLAELPRDVSRPLVAYLALFRARTRALAWERALRLAREALALQSDTAVVGQALSETVEAMRRKQQTGAWRPLTTHNYLRSVIASVGEQGPPTGTAPVPAEDAAKPRQQSHTAKALTDIERWRRGER